MYICMCNPFSDKDVAEHLDQNDGKTTVGRVYNACSGGEKMNCGSCSDELRSMVDEHNNKIIVNEISDNMEKVSPARVSTQEPA